MNLNSIRYYISPILIWNPHKVFKNSKKGDDCKISDFDIFTPGVNSKRHCFQGAIGLKYIKTSTNVCRFNPKSLPIIRKEPCYCSIDDFQWYFSFLKSDIGFLMKNGKCFVEKIQLDILIKNQCKPGNFYTRNSQ